MAALAPGRWSNTAMEATLRVLSGHDIPTIHMLKILANHRVLITESEPFTYKIKVGLAGHVFLARPRQPLSPTR